MKTLVAEDRQPGCYVVSWNGEHEDGREMATGVYLYQIGVHQTDGRAAGEFVDTQKAILMR